jgi:hypothetical protein
MTRSVIIRVWKRPGVRRLTAWDDFGAYSGIGRSLWHPTQNVDQIANDGAVFTN